MSIDLSVNGAIATVTINNPAELNALDVRHLRDLVAIFESVGKRGDIRAVLLTGAGERAFVAGANIKRMSVMSIAEAQEFGALGHVVARAIESTPQPVIAAINGFALGGGCELSLACDIRIASTTAVFAQPEVALGIPPGWGGSQRLPRLVGKGIASELIFTGRRVKAEEALRIGLVNQVVAPEDLVATATSLAESIAANSPDAVRKSKRLIARAFDADFQASLDHEAQVFAQTFEGHDQREGMTAFVEKRQAVFEDVKE
ncbi:MAG: enoyl-CoA hydratase/isomerase family protein [Thermomicrobiales bacterium]|nr:enoyl-CoA hydratase/isomerase family protein [Thermomicrobiales bacterium]